MLADTRGAVLWASASARARREALIPGAQLDAALDVAPDGVTAALESGLRSSAPVPAVLRATGGMLRVSVSRAADGVALLRLPTPPGGRNAAFADLSRRLDRASARDLRRLRALRRAESLHRSVVEAISEGLVVFDVAGRVLTVNPAATELFACPAAQLAGRAADDPSWGYLDARGRPLPRDRQPGLAPSGSRGSVTRVLGVRRPDGEVRWVRATARPLEGDGVPGVAVLLSDITRARAARREREEAQSLARLGSFTYEARGDRLDASPELLGMLRVGRARRVSLEALVACVHPDDRAEIRLALNALLDGGAPIDLTHRLSTPGMPAAIVRLRARADGVSGSGRILGTVQDVTAEATRARMLQEAELRFRVAFENAPIGMAIVQLDGRFGRVNRALTEMLGYTDEELLARTFQDITHPDDLDTDLGQVRALLDGERSAYSLEKRYLTAAGEVLWVILSASLVRDEIGQPIYFIAQIMDISGRKRMEERLHRLADRDPLTGLLNRRRFEEELREEVARRR
ncbi:MAG TPA: PAS domain S-box protein, partial [Miltoncostaeaceae bacterium]|nr:PAS domain S-box protein [Miltoncostaeaceae bacterium]